MFEIVLHAHGQLVELIPLLSQAHHAVLRVPVNHTHHETGGATHIVIRVPIRNLIIKFHDFSMTIYAVLHEAKKDY